ncbi:MAG: Hpt domain-containing protein [Acholeplasmatales bacterium]|nr:Hpt domain-containing protein [Acholeplasmatales bacterium]
MAYVDKNVALKYLANSESLFDRIRKGFLANNKDGIEKINQYVEDENIQDLYNYIHSIKGISLNLGSNTLYEDSQAVLEKLKKEEINLPLIEMFIDTFKCVYDELSRM